MYPLNDQLVDISNQIKETLEGLNQANDICTLTRASRALQKLVLIQKELLISMTIMKGINNNING